jgi:superfamily I DNA/RNA helicase
MAALALLNSPTDHAAYRYILMTEGLQAAQRARQQAALTGTDVVSGIEHYRPLGSGLAYLADGLGRLGVSRECRDLIQQVADTIPDATIADIILSIQREQEAIEEVGHGVTITTMHGSKGREWDRVLIAACEQECCPGRRDDIEEARRLMYVAATRARKTLAISSSARRQQTFGRKDYEERTPSQFIAELVNNGPENR